ncbi:sulfur transfer protein SufE [Ewingella americana]
MLAPHPFGHEITTQSLSETFSGLRLWEDRYRQLILLAKKVSGLRSPAENCRHRAFGL